MFRRLPLIAAITAAAAVTTTNGPATADPVVLPDIDGGLLSCTQLVPRVLSLDNTPVRLDLRILLDGASQSEAQTAVAAMRRAYEPAGVTGNNVAGLADCIGGVRYPDRAFAVGEVHGVGTSLLPIPVSDGTGKILAHEIGHLLGGHHHYAGPEGLLASDPSALTLMGPTLSLISLRFSTLNTAMVKGHSQRYATP